MSGGSFINLSASSCEGRGMCKGGTASEGKGAGLTCPCRMHRRGRSPSLVMHHCLWILPALPAKRQQLEPKAMPKEIRPVPPSLQAASVLWKHRPAAGRRPRSRLFMNLARTSALKPLPLTGVGGATSGCCLPITLRAMPHGLTKRIGAIALTLAGRAMSGFHGARLARLGQHCHAFSASEPPCHSPAGLALRAILSLQCLAPLAQCLSSGTNTSHPPADRAKPSLMLSGSPCRCSLHSADSMPSCQILQHRTLGPALSSQQCSSHALPRKTFLGATPLFFTRWFFS